MKRNRLPENRKKICHADAGRSQQTGGLTISDIFRKLFKVLCLLARMLDIECGLGIFGKKWTQAFMFQTSAFHFCWNLFCCFGRRASFAFIDLRSFWEPLFTYNAYFLLWSYQIILWTIKNLKWFKNEKYSPCFRHFSKYKPELETFNPECKIKSSTLYLFTQLT